MGVVGVNPSVGEKPVPFSCLDLLWVKYQSIHQVVVSESLDGEKDRENDDSDGNHFTISSVVKSLIIFSIVNCKEGRYFFNVTKTISGSISVYWCEIKFRIL